jgi:hypothetical protein
MKFTKKQMIFLGVFIAISVFADFVNIGKIVGAENQKFTLFQLLGPVAGGFLGALLGPIAVLMAEAINFVVQAKAFTLINILRLLPMMVAAFYFGTLKEGKQLNVLKIIIPAACMTLFIAHPIGRQAWVYSLFWLIPMVALLKPLRNFSFVKALGATFTAHAIGATVFVYTFGLSKEAWIGLIPVTATERLVFACGIFASYVILTTAFDLIDQKVDIRNAIDINKKSSLLSFF